MRLRDTHYELVDPDRLVEYHDPTDFDRVAFAMRTLRRLRTGKMTVAVYQAASSLQIERGRDLRRGGESWALVGIPPHASREHIVYALAELAGVASVPYAVQMLLADEKASGA